MSIAIVSILGLALLAPPLHRVARSATGWLLALLPLALAGYFLATGASVAEQGRILAAIPWSPELGVSLAFALDGLSLLFALLICGIGALILVYAGGYLAGHPQLGRFYAFLLLFMGAMLGLVLADNVLTLFVFWELTSISSFLLIGFSHERPEARAAARQALLITGGGGLALLAGLILLGIAGGSYELSALLGRGELVRAHPLYGAILPLVLAGAFTKSAQFPFHFWLPSAMEAPTPVSAYLHSATMVKAGVYLLARLAPVLGGSDAWLFSLSACGGLTMVVGGVLALYQTDLKRVLAYTTVSALGVLVLLIGLGTEQAIIAAMAFLLAHGLYKGALFMIAGIIDHETGIRNVEKLGGLRRFMPITAAVAVLAAVSLAGFGPVFSFIAKELLFEAVLGSERFGALLVIASVAASAIFVTEALIVTVRPFFSATALPRPAHEPPLSMWLGPAILAVAGLALGLFPSLAVMLLAGASAAALGETVEVDLALWHGFNLALAMTVAAVLLGVGLYYIWTWLRRSTSWVERALGFWPSDAYHQLFDGINRLARGLTRTLQHGYLRHYLHTILITTVLLVGATLMLKDGVPRALPWSELRFYEAAIALLMLLAAGFALVAPGRLSAVASLGVVGYGVALIYILYGAPDLAMTQILVETLTVLLFVLVFYLLPPFQRLSTATSRARDALLSLLVGGLMTVLVLAATATPPESRLAAFFAENSKQVAHGSNIVNVILVDFRGLDTLGEVTVLSIAAFGVFALLKLGRRTPRPMADSDQATGVRGLLRRSLGQGPREREERT
jgi:multicomponent Na+:H+ antiporter subunit A